MLRREYLNESPTGQLLGTARPGANPSMMWKLATRSLYASGDLPVLAVREALQNSADSIRQAYREGSLRKGEGRFGIRLLTNDEYQTSAFALSHDAKVLELTDNGVGMSLETFTTKFMILGETTKKDSGLATGGFGIAKAVILGASSSFRWTLQTRDFTALSDGDGADIRLLSSPYLAGLRLTLFDWDTRYWEYYDQASESVRMLPQRLMDCLRGNDLDDIQLFYNDRLQEPYFSRRKGSYMNVFGTDWGGSQVRIKKYATQDPPQFWIRANGLLQFRRAAPQVLQLHVVVDVSPTVPPGHQNYPFNAARDGFLGESSRVFAALIDTLRQEALSASREEQDEVWDREPEVDPALLAIQKALLSRIADPELQRLLAGDSGQRSQSGNRSAQGSDQSPEDHHPEADPSPESSPGHAPTDESGKSSSNLPSESKATGVSTSQPQFYEQVLPSPVVDVSGGRNVRRRGNPLGALGALRIARGMDRERVKGFRRNLKRYIPMLILWDVMLRIIATEAQVHGRFNVGFVLEPDVNGLAEKVPEKPATIFINPIALEDAIDYLKRQPLRVTGWLYGVALHELAHFNGNMGQGHNQHFASERELLQRRTFHLVPRFVKLTADLLGLEPEPDPLIERVKDLEAELKRCGKARERGEERRVELTKLKQALRRCQQQMQQQVVDSIDSAEQHCQDGQCLQPGLSMPSPTSAENELEPVEQISLTQDSNTVEQLMNRLYEQLIDDVSGEERPLIHILYQRLLPRLRVRVEQRLRLRGAHP